MAVYDIQCNALTGGASGALDSHDGNTLSDGSKALVQTNGVAYLYRLNASSGAAESSPGIISPDSNAGTKRWILQGIYLESIQLANGAVAADAISNSVTGTSATTLITEAGLVDYVTGVGGLAASSLAGYVDRPKFEYKDTDEIYLNPGRYHHDGTAEQFLYWDSQLTYQFGSAGSNANSSDLGASEWHYLYIDDSELAGAVMVAGEFVNNTTAPTYTVAKHGWYNGNDRCIGAFKTNASSQIVEFIHDGGGFFEYIDSVEDRASAALSATTWTAATLTAPDFGDAARVLCGFHFYDTASTSFYYRKTGSGATTGRWLARTASSAVVQSVNTVVTYNSSQQIDIYATAAANSVIIYTHGYYFPRGM